MQDSRGAGTGSNTSGPAVGEPSTGAGGSVYRTLADVPFRTGRGERGQVEVGLDGGSIVVVTKMRLDDGSLLESTRGVRDASDLLTALTGLNLEQKSVEQRLLRIVNDQLSRTGVHR